MPTTYAYKITVTLPNGTTTRTYWATALPTEDDTKKTFTGKRDGETTDGSMEIRKDKILDEKIEPV